MQGSSDEVVYKTHTNRAMPFTFTFDEYKQKCARYLQEIIDYDEKGNKSHQQRELQVLKGECLKYKQNFETLCKTTGELMEFRRTMENKNEEFCREVEKTPFEGTWEKSMFSSIKSKMDACISYLKQMEALILSGNGPGITTQTASLDFTVQISNSLAELKRFL